MFCSTIVPTIGRPTLARAVGSVLDQEFRHDDFEVIVVNDSGQPLPEEEWQRHARVRIIHTNKHNRSVARNAGAAIAKGRYLHFLDDDDWILPGVFEEFWQLSLSNEAGWLYGAFRLVDNSGDTIAEICPEEAGNCFMQLLAWEWLPLQASIVKAESFFSVGGFVPLNSLLGGFEDVHLSRQIALNYDIARLSKIVACIRIGTESSTTNYSNMFMQNRQSRETVLASPGTFARMKDSARSSPSRSSYWYGKILYYYLASAKWQVQQRRLFMATSRFAFVLVGLFTAGRRTVSSDFWQGVFRPHYPRMGMALQEMDATHLYEDTI